MSQRISEFSLSKGLMQLKTKTDQVVHQVAINCHVDVGCSALEVPLLKWRSERCNREHVGFPLRGEHATCGAKTLG